MSKVECCQTQENTDAEKRVLPKVEWFQKVKGRMLSRRNWEDQCQGKVGIKVRVLSKLPRKRAVTNKLLSREECCEMWSVVKCILLSSVQCHQLDCTLPLT